MSAPLYRCQRTTPDPGNTGPSASVGGRYRTPENRFWKPFRFPSSPTKNCFRAQHIKKAARIGLPMGGSLDMTSLTSWWGASAALADRFIPGEGLAVVLRRTHVGDRSRQIPALRPSLSHGRHDCSLSLPCLNIVVHGSMPVNPFNGISRGARIVTRADCFRIAKIANFSGCIALRSGPDRHRLTGDGLAHVEPFAGVPTRTWGAWTRRQRGGRGPTTWATVLAEHRDRALRRCPGPAGHRHRPLLTAGRFVMAARQPRSSGARASRTRCGGLALDSVSVTVARPRA
jgi:hypothetical protein